MSLDMKFKQLIDYSRIMTTLLVQLFYVYLVSNNC